jgi:uncharacterized metal-binding protein YceD (DUF177 family)
MDYLDQFELPIQSLQNGLHHYDFELDQDFFECFEDSPIREGIYKVSLDLDKKSTEFVLNFDIKGYFEGPCDRCLADIEIPSSVQKLIWVKFKDELEGEDHDDDVIYISSSNHSFNISKLVYELIILAIPIAKRYDCENDPNPKCDFKVLAFIQDNDNESGNSNLGDQLRKISEN